tara:strand:+ start:427 stop:1650 length:1224 start_codon:yes stop_codon:yes gene_type:complete
MQVDVFATTVGNMGMLPGTEGFVAVSFSLRFFIVALSAWLIGIIVGVQYLSVRTSFLVVTVKIAIVVLYATVLADGSWYTGGDDWGYVLRSVDLYLKNVNPLAIWFTPEGQHLHAYPNSALLKWYNSSLFYVFGPSYYVGLMFFPALSMITGAFVVRLLRSSGLTELSSQIGVIFYLLHWDTITWTSFLNLKEPIVTCLLFFALFGASLIPRNIFSSMAIIGTSFFAFQKIRFYFPFLLTAGICLSILSHYCNRVSVKHLIVATVGGIGVIGIALATKLINWSQILYAAQLAEPESLAYGFAKTLLSPLPWNLTAPAEYLLICSTLHLILLPLTLTGAWLLFRTSFTGKLIVSVWFVSLAAYAVQPMVLSPRHLAPVRALEILMQFQALLVVFELYWDNISGSYGRK